MVRIRIAVVSALVLAGCTTPAKGPDDSLGRAITSPLSDLNIVQAEIPPALVAAKKAPYQAPVDASCDGIEAEVEELDALLGADLDTRETLLNPSLIERGVDAASDAALGHAVGTVRGATEGIIPFRSWVRKLSGAEKYSKEVAAAISAGTVRRSFLKGHGDARGCLVPASPRRK
jgi:hypothetical protein